MAIRSKKEKTINSETSKVFIVNFLVLALVGVFAVVATNRGNFTFNEMRTVQIPQFQLAQKLKQEAFEIIGIFYLVAGESDLEVQMEQMHRYDDLAASFSRNLDILSESSSKVEIEEDKIKLINLLKDTASSFERLNQDAREMTFANMESNQIKGREYFEKIIKEIVVFKKLIGDIETIVIEDLDRTTRIAQNALNRASIIGIVTTVLAIFISLGLIRYLMNFLSVTLLPISNLMHNLRQAVFSINRNNIVISPVSQYSQQVFSKNIVGENIFDLVFKSLGEKSEAYSAARTALTTVFGEDELQWSLMEDNFPKSVTLRSDIGSEKILKMTYRPLFQKDQKVQDIMIVAEDVTELEKVKQDAISMQSEILIIQSLIRVERGDLEPFFTDTLRGLSQCFSLVGSIENDSESRKLIFRILHTIKGNSRVFNLSSISEVVHIAESSIVEISNKLDAKNAVAPDIYHQFLSNLRDIETSVARHTKMANALFGIYDAAVERQEDLLYQNIVCIDESLRLNREVNFDHAAISRGALIYQYVLCGIRPGVFDSIDLSLVIAKDFESRELVDKIQLLAGAMRAAPHLKSQALADFQDAYFRFFLQSPRKTKYATTSDDLVEISEKLIVVSDLIYSCEEGPSGETSQSPNIEGAIFELFEACERQRMLVARYSVQRLVIELLSGGSKKEFDLVLSQIWDNIVSILHIDSSFNLDSDSRNKLKNFLRSIFNKEGNDIDLSSFAGVDCMAIEIFRYFRKSSISPVSLLKYIGIYCNKVGEEAAIQCLIGDDLTRRGIEKCFEMLKDGLTAKVHKERFSEIIATIREPVLVRALQKSSDNVVFRIDLYKIAANFIHDKSLVHGDSAQQTYEISSHWYERLRDMVNELGESADSRFRNLVGELEDLVASLFDYPVKSLCSKMDPMVKDIGRRLGKNVNYLVSGDSTSMPREVAYALRDALVHMLRNSLDHGIEIPEIRVKASKPEVALIEVNCVSEGDQIRVVVRDDGAGIDVEKVMNRALQMKAITPEQAKSMDKNSKQELIFISRLSTKDEVSSLSGRGVGMDAVKAIIIDRLKGKISLETELGKGTSVIIQIPKPKRSLNIYSGQNEIDKFLRGARSSIGVAIKMTEFLSSDQEVRNSLLRLLNTIRGNAAMHNLKGIADMAHFSQSAVTALSQELDAGRHVETAAVHKLETGLKMIQEVLLEQLRIQKSKVVGISENRALEQALEKSEALVDEAIEMFSLLQKIPIIAPKIYDLLDVLNRNLELHAGVVQADGIHTVRSLLTNVLHKLGTNQNVESKEVENIEIELNLLKDRLGRAYKKLVKLSRNKGPKSELEASLAGASKALGDSIQIASRVQIDVESIGRLVQILASIKGDARIHRLTALENAVSELESIVARINDRVTKNMVPVPSDLDEMQTNLQNIRLIVDITLKKVCSQTSRVKPTSDVGVYLLDAKRDLSDFLNQISDLAKDESVGRVLFQKLHTMKGNAQLHNFPGLVNLLHQLESMVERVNASLSAGIPFEPAVVADLTNTMGDTIDWLDRHSGRHAGKAS